ncbi:MAG: serine/threonine-protein kinase [Planctomycetales bacterium]|nr:serine/threonine-protein kinase [Planctomycetales bacterium]
MDPRVLGPFATLSELGRGGFATVYRARDLRDGREVALKVLRSGEGGPGPDEIRRFRREVEAAQALDHPGIVKVLDWSGADGRAMSKQPPGEPGGRVEWVALELVEGESLAARIAREPLPWREAVTIARDAADALAAAHAKGILHRDVKPSNILLDREGHPHVADFGLAKLTATGSKLTKTGQALGTPAYMSPEQARGEASSLIPATDVWSLGCVLYEMLAGRRPFEGETDAAVVGRVLLAEPPRLRTLRGDVPEGVERVVRASLAKRARDRYRDAAGLRDDLDRVLRDERPKARLPGGRRRKFVAVALGGAAVAWGAVAAWPRPDAPAPVPAASAASAVEALAAKARALRQTGPRRAAEMLREALELEPARDDLRIERGLLLWAVGESAGAREEWGLVAPGSSEGPRARLLVGLEAFFRLAREDAKPHFMALRESPGRVGSLARGASLALSEDWSRARASLGGVEGWEADFLRGYIETWDAAGDHAAAVREYGAALDSGISLAWAWNNRGRAKRDLGDTAGAILDYDRALELDPRLALTWNNRGVAKRDLGDLAGAVLDYDRALELDPRLALAWNNRGAAIRELGNFARAVADLDHAIELDPRLVMAWTNRGAAKGALGDFAGAFTDLDRALELDPRYAKAWYNRGVAKSNLGDLSGAMTDWDRALELDPREVAAWTNRGAAKQTLGDLTGAVADFDRALELRSRSVTPWFNRGAAKRALGDLPGAVADFERALDVAPPGWPQRAKVEEDLVRLRTALDRK